MALTIHLRFPTVLLVPLIAALSLPVLSGCGSDSAGDDDGMQGTVELDPGPGNFTMEFETSSDFFTQMDGPRFGLPSSPHGSIQIWYSTNIEPAITSTSFDAPEGTVAIKTQDQDDNGTIENIMVMIKQAAGSDSTTNDWLYERRLPDGSVETSGGPTLDFCAQCHASWPDTANLAGTTVVD